ncbi:MAG: bacteriohemerythrin [Gammaproteobacteria bacterium]|nr:MAG: bacteriohemerythrin [Gammaproteobacteria bacterium]
MPAPERYTWDSHLEKGIGPMDATHQEFVEMVDGLLSCPDTELVERLQALAEHTREHFAQEDRWMAESGFPPIAIHEEEHRRVLSAMEQVLTQARQGESEAARQLVAQLPAWFEQHSATMDNALAMHLRHTGHPAARG